MVQNDLGDYGLKDLLMSVHVDYLLLRGSKAATENFTDKPQDKGGLEDGDRRTFVCGCMRAQIKPELPFGVRVRMGSGAPCRDRAYVCAASAGTHCVTSGWKDGGIIHKR